MEWRRPIVNHIILIARGKGNASKPGFNMLCITVAGLMAIICGEPSSAITNPVRVAVVLAGVLAGV